MHVLLDPFALKHLPTLRWLHPELASVHFTVNHLRLIPGTLLPNGVSAREGERHPTRTLLLSVCLLVLPCVLHAHWHKRNPGTRWIKYKWEVRKYVIKERQIKTYLSPTGGPCGELI